MISTTDFDRLLEAWNAHQDLRRHGATVADLANSRGVLDERRAALR